MKKMSRKFCDECGEALGQGSKFCPKCGAAVSRQESSKQLTTNTKAKDHDDYVTTTLIAVVLPIVGLIVGIVYLTKDRKVDKKLGEHLVAFSILFFILWSVAYFVLVSNLFETPSIYETPDSSLYLP